MIGSKRYGLFDKMFRATSPLFLWGPKGHGKAPPPPNNLYLLHFTLFVAKLGHLSMLMCSDRIAGQLMCVAAKNGSCIHLARKTISVTVWDISHLTSPALTYRTGQNTPMLTKLADLFVSSSILERLYLSLGGYILCHTML